MKGIILRHERLLPMPHLGDVAAENLEFNSNCNPKTCVTYSSLHLAHLTIKEMHKDIRRLQAQVDSRDKSIQEKDEMIKTLIETIKFELSRIPKV